MSPLLSLLSILAEASGMDLSPLLNAGIASAVLAFLLVKLEPRLRAIETSIDSITRALMIMVISQPQSTENERDQAGKIVQEIDQKKERK